MARTQEEAGAENLFDPFGQWKAWREAGMDAWSKAMIDFVNSEAYARASAQWLDTYLTMSQSFQQVMDRAMTETLSHYNMPSAADIERLAERMTNVELRLDDLDARSDEILRLLRNLVGTASATERAAEKAERVAERVERTAAEASQAADRAAAAAEKAAECVSRQAARETGEARKTSEPGAEAARPVATAAAAKAHPHAPAAAPEGRDNSGLKRQERK